MTIRTEFNRGDTVYIRTDPDQIPYIIIGILIYIDGGIQYFIAHNHIRVYMYGAEISKERDHRLLKEFGEGY